MILLLTHERNFIEDYKWVFIAQELGSSLLGDLPTLKGFNKLIAPIDKENSPLFSQADLEKGVKLARAFLSKNNFSFNGQDENMFKWLFPEKEKLDFK